MDLLYRKHEGVTLLCQNNETRQVLIYGINPVMQRLTGHYEDEVKGRTLQSFLNDGCATHLDEYLEYEGDANDLAQVMGKMRHLKFRHKDGRDTPVEGFKIVRIDAKDRHHWFRLIVEDAVHKREVEAFKRILAENFKGHEVIDEESGLPDAASIRKDLELSQYYVISKGLKACFAYVKLDDFPELLGRHGRKAAMAALGQVAQSLRRNLRADDTIGRIADDAVAVILMDIEVDSARIVMNRLRGFISAEPLAVTDVKKKNITVSIGFAPIDGNTLELPEQCAAALGADAGTFSQVGARA